MTLEFLEAHRGYFEPIPRTITIGLIAGPGHWRFEAAKYLVREWGFAPAWSGNDREYTFACEPTHQRTLWRRGGYLIQVTRVTDRGDPWPKQRLADVVNFSVSAATVDQLQEGLTNAMTSILKASAAHAG